MPPLAGFRWTPSISPAALFPRPPGGSSARTENASLVLIPGIFTYLRDHSPTFGHGHEDPAATTSRSSRDEEEYGGGGGRGRKAPQHRLSTNLASSEQDFARPSPPQIGDFADGKAPRGQTLAGSSISSPPPLPPPSRKHDPGSLRLLDQVRSNHRFRLLSNDPSSSSSCALGRFLVSSLPLSCRCFFLRLFCSLFVTSSNARFGSIEIRGSVPHDASL